MPIYHNVITEHANMTKYYTYSYNWTEVPIIYHTKLKVCHYEGMKFAGLLLTANYQNFNFKNELT